MTGPTTQERHRDRGPRRAGPRRVHVTVLHRRHRHALAASDRRRAGRDGRWSSCSPAPAPPRTAASSTAPCAASPTTCRAGPPPCSTPRTPSARSTPCASWSPSCSPRPGAAGSRSRSCWPSARPSAARSIASYFAGAGHAGDRPGPGPERFGARLPHPPGRDRDGGAPGAAAVRRDVRAPLPRRRRRRPVPGGVGDRDRRPDRRARRPGDRHRGRRRHARRRRLARRPPRRRPGRREPRPDGRPRRRPAPRRPPTVGRPDPATPTPSRVGRC